MSTPSKALLTPPASGFSTTPVIQHDKRPAATDDLSLTRCNLLRRDFESLDEALLKHAAPRPFSLSTLAAAISDRCSPTAVLFYLQSYPPEPTKVTLNQLVENKHPLLFYAAERNSADIVRILLEFEASPEGCDTQNIPVLAYAIMRSKFTILNPLEVVKTLLARGARPYVLPADMWTNYIRPPPVEPEKESLKSTRLTRWCTAQHRRLLAETMHLSIRYYLVKATQMTPILARGLQLAREHNYLQLLKTPYLIIGQHYACNIVVEQVSSHIGMKVEVPLVLTFAGLSGHGKTELATRMGELLDVPLTTIDCSQMKSDSALFGPPLGYAGNAVGSQLNNFLATRDGTRSVVFLDEFDKTDQEVRHSLLLVLDSGEYHDRRTNKLVDCSKTIWILATNLGDTQISRWYREHMEDLTEDQRLRVPVKVLTNSLKAVFVNKFGAPMAGRMASAICPFMPFDLREQAVITHKFLLGLVEQVRRNIDTSAAEKHFPGHIHLAIQNDGRLCEHMAKESYISELGARSLKSAVNEVRRSFYTSFVHSDIPVEDHMNDGPLTRYNIQLQPVAESANEVIVVEDGMTEFFEGYDNVSDPMQLDKDDAVMSGMMGTMTFDRKADDSDSDV
ncbi:hypothetical protein AMS68_007667 [Peltaster fructicola]|uniref:ATPase AAA-type core domain-containing protein n=1 Tax=Peltaster fructicola TaxID=286661 RepID=A0A6H0Y6C2_9PEZI|nr:hypothetical protein AMS68_007667 [Peltaster fructicola]